MNESTAEEHFVGVGEVVGEGDDVQAATCIAGGTVVVVVIVNVGVVAGGTPVPPSRGWWDQNGGVVDDTGRAGSMDTGASRLVPSEVREEVGSVGTCKADYIPPAGGQCTGVVRMMLGEVHKVTRKRRREK